MVARCSVDGVSVVNPPSFRQVADAGTCTRPLLIVTGPGAGGS